MATIVPISPSTRRTIGKRTPTPINPVRPDGIPRALRNRSQWVAWNWVTCDGQHFLDTPYDPVTGRVADTEHPSTWGSFAAALHLARQRSLAGVGFVLARGDPFVVVDFDRCRDPATGELDFWASDTMSFLGSYTEATPNGTGLRIWLRADDANLPDVTTDRHRRRTEIVAAGRVVPVTGCRIYDHIRECDPATIEEPDDELDALFLELTGHELARPMPSATVAARNRKAKSA